MANESICPQCGRPRPQDSPQGLCPQCLLEAGFPTGATPASGEPTAPPRASLPSLAELAPLFPALEILELLGQGGMGAVYKARQKQLQRVVALKILPPGTGKDPAFAERFTREAQALARLNHPGIVTLYEFGRTADGLYYFLMEFVDGVTLRQLLAGDRIASREALAIVPQICDALQYAHDQGVVHRDIKPENILLDRRGRVKVADFGVAKLIGAEGGPPAEAGKTASITLTEAGKALGTPRYMAPEQTARPGEVDHRADIYALGVVFYQMLTGELPGQEIQPPSQKVQIDVRLDEVVLRALEREPDRRYQQVSEVKTCVETILADSSKRAVATPDQPAAPDSGSSAPGWRSRIAIAGAVWISLFFLNWVVAYTPAGWAVTQPLRGSGVGPIFELFVVLPLMVLGYGAVFGATILGLVALREIRRSRGAQGGAGLAVFDILFFPVLLSNLWIWWLCRQILSQVPPPAGGWGWMLVAAAPALLALDAVAVRAAWRRARDYLAGPPPPERPRATGTWAQVWSQTGLRLLVVTVVQGALFETLDQASIHWKESTGELWQIGLMLATIAGLVWACWPGYHRKQSWVFWGGGTIVSAFLLLAWTNIYAWHLRPNLGLYRESDWVVRNPGFQRQLRADVAKNLWRRPLVQSQFDPLIEIPLSIDTAHPIRLANLDNGRESSRTNADWAAAVETSGQDGWDLLARARDGSLVVLGLGLQVTPAIDKDWDNAAPQEIADYFALERAQPKESIVLWPNADYWRDERATTIPRQSWPAAVKTSSDFFFRTRQGALGILRIELPAGAPDQAILKYRLVRK